MDAGTQEAKRLGRALGEHVGMDLGVKIETEASETTSRPVLWRGAAMIRAAVDSAILAGGLPPDRGGILIKSVDTDTDTGTWTSTDQVAKSEDYDALQTD